MLRGCASAPSTAWAGASGAGAWEIAWAKAQASASTPGTAERQYIRAKARASTAEGKAREGLAVGNTSAASLGRHPRRRGALAGVSRGNICSESKQASIRTPRWAQVGSFRGKPRASTSGWGSRVRCGSRVTPDGSSREGALGLVVLPEGKAEGPRDTKLEKGRSRVPSAGRSHSDPVRLAM